LSNKKMASTIFPPTHGSTKMESHQKAMEIKKIYRSILQIILNVVRLGQQKQ